MFKSLLATTMLVGLCALGAFAQDIPSMNQQLGEKKPGVVRIGIIAPIADVGKDFSYADTPLAVRNTLEVALSSENH